MSAAVLKLLRLLRLAVPDSSSSGLSGCQDATVTKLSKPKRQKSSRQPHRRGKPHRQDVYDLEEGRAQDAFMLQRLVVSWMLAATQMANSHRCLRSAYTEDNLKQKPTYIQVAMRPPAAQSWDEAQSPRKLLPMRRNALLGKAKRMPRERASAMFLVRNCSKQELTMCQEHERKVCIIVFKLK